MRAIGGAILLWAGLGAVGWAQPPLSLESAVHTALQQNPRLQSALKDVEQARAQVGAASASLYPLVDVAITNNSASRNTGANNANAVSNGGVVTDVNGNVIAANNNNNGSNITSINQLALRVEHILLDFGQRAEAIRAVERLAEAQVAQAGAVRQDIVLQVRQIYFQTHTDQETVRIQQEVVENQQRHLRESLGFYKAGLQARNEVTKAEADLAQAQLDLVLAQNALEQDWVNLNQSMGLSQTTQYALTVDPVDPAWNPPLDQVVAVSYGYRPEARQLAFQIEAASARMEQAYRNRYPTLSANAQAGYRGVNGPLNDYWSVGFNLSFNLFNGFLDRYQAEGFRAQAESLAALLESTRQQVYRDTAAALINLRNARAAIDAATVNVRSSVDNFTLARKRYESGLGSNLEYQDAQLLWARAQIGEVQANNRYRTALASLLRATGIEEFPELQTLVKGSEKP